MDSNSDVVIREPQPIPNNIGSKTKKKYPFHRLVKPGMSLVVPLDIEPNIKSLRSCTSAYAKRTGMKLAVELQEEEVVVWRIE